MSPSRSVAVRCRIFAGGFSGERVVHVGLADGNEHVALAPREYCWAEGNRPLKLEEPQAGESVVGSVAARLIEQANGQAAISLPSGDVIVVHTNQLTPRPERPEETHVSV